MIEREADSEDLSHTGSAPRRVPRYWSRSSMRSLGAEASRRVCFTKPNHFEVWGSHRVFASYHSWAPPRDEEDLVEFLGSYSVQPTAARPDPRELGHPVALSFLLGRNESVAIGVTSFIAYHGGFEFALVMLFTDPDNRVTPLSSMHRATLAQAGRVVSPPDPEQFRLTLSFSDQSSASSTTIGPFRGSAPRKSPEQIARSLTLLDGSGGGVQSRLRWFASPLPPPGQIVFSCEWPTTNVSWRYQLDAADQLHDAAQKSRFLLDHFEE